MHSAEREGEPVSYRQWASRQDLEAGHFDGTTGVAEGLQLAEPSGVVAYRDPFGAGRTTAFEVGRWLSPVVRRPDGFSELVASWSARTPPGTWIEVSVRVWPLDSPAEADLDVPAEFVLGRWAEGTATIHRTSVAGQEGRLATVEVDVLVARPQSLGAWQLVVSLLRLVGSASSPALTMVGAMTSPSVSRVDLAGVAPHRPVTVPATSTDTAVRPGTMRRPARTLDVPSYSQMLHRGSYPEYDNGGEAWCSPTSTAMVLAYWGRRRKNPLDDGSGGEWYPDRAVVDAVAGTFDYGFQGAGNWSFNTAYASLFGLAAFVTRLGSLDEAGLFTDAGIPLVASASFAAEELTGAGYSTRGHLLVIVGFTASGDVVVNDPASHLIASNDEVRVVYDRAEFERVWLGRSGGLVYVVRPPDVALPPTPRGTTPHW